jgi:hypothetical protein
VNKGRKQRVAVAERGHGHTDAVHDQGANEILHDRSATALRDAQCFDGILRNARRTKLFAELAALVLWRSSRGGGRPGADRLTIHDQLNAAVLLSSFRSIVGSDRLGFAKPFRADCGSGDSLLNQKISDGIGAPLGKLLVEFVAADAIGVPFHLQGQTRVREQNA